MIRRRKVSMIVNNNDGLCISIPKIYNLNQCSRGSASNTANNQNNDPLVCADEDCFQLVAFSVFVRCL